MSVSLATILAYGERSSGKTYTMTGITESAVADIYDYIEKVLFFNANISDLEANVWFAYLMSDDFQNPEREFVVKFTAMEIYNECVRDLLSTDNAPLKLVDDPEVSPQDLYSQTLPNAYSVV